MTSGRARRDTLLQRDAENAATGEVGPAEISPHLVPCREGLRDGAGIAIGTTIGATDDAMLVARGGVGIGNHRRLLEQRYLIATSAECPGRRKTANARTDDGDLHFRLFRS